MPKLTAEGKLDHVFQHDLDERVEKLPRKQQLPSYGKNALHPPTRALTAEESAILDQIGLPPEEKGAAVR